MHCLQLGNSTDDFGQMLLGFLERFGDSSSSERAYDYTSDAVAVRRGGVVRKAQVPRCVVLRVADADADVLSGDTVLLQQLQAHVLPLVSLHGQAGPMANMRHRQGGFRGILLGALRV